MNNDYNNPQVPPMYKPLSAWAYFGYQILFAIQILGFILLLVFSFSNDNINRRNFARSYFCLFVIILIVFLFVFISTGSLAFITNIFNS